MAEPDEGFGVSVGAPLTADKGLESSVAVERSGFKYTSVSVNQQLPAGKLNVTEAASTQDVRKMLKGVCFLQPDTNGLSSAEFHSCTDPPPSKVSDFLVAI